MGLGLISVVPRLMMMEQVYAPVFQRNARFAVKRPVPELGNADTPIEDVYK